MLRLFGAKPKHSELEDEIAQLHNKVARLEKENKVYQAHFESVLTYSGTYPVWKALQEFRDIVDQSVELDKVNPWHIYTLDSYLSKIVESTAEVGKGLRMHVDLDMFTDGDALGVDMIRGIRNRSKKIDDVFHQMQSDKQFSSAEN